MRTSTATILGVLVLLAACTRPNPAYDPNPELPDECRQGTEVTEEFSEFAHPDKLDILFVIDGSNDDPVALQELFANAVTPMGAVIEALEIDALIAVATTDGTVTGLAPPGVTGAGCSGNKNDIVEVGTSDWDDAVRCNFFAAPTSSPYDQPLLVVSKLIDSPPEGFLRADARLLVVIASRSDDCTAAGPISGAPRDACATTELQGVASLVGQWTAKRDADGLGLAVFAGPPSGTGAEVRPVCSSTLGSALPGNRLFEATRYLEFSTFHSVCTDDVFQPLADTIEAFVGALPVTFCPSEGMSQEPLKVLADRDAVPLGEDGFIYVGSTSSCDSGAIQFAPDALRGTDEVEITYCAPDG